MIAVNNKDIKMLKELWMEYTCWEVIHLQKVVKFIVEKQWHQGLHEILKSYTTDVLF